MQSQTRAIITSASDKFFPVLINLLGSIKSIYPNHPKIYIYDLGLFATFANELKNIENVELIRMPAFCPFWRKCFTWKTYIFSNPLADLNFYLDAGCQILRPLEEIFETIDKIGYFAIEAPSRPPHPCLDDMTPEEYKSIFRIDEKFYRKGSIVSGIFGFKKNSAISRSLDDLHSASLSGLCLGYSEGEERFSKGINKNEFKRNCRLFRHDNTLLSLILRRDFDDLQTGMNAHSKYAGCNSPHDHPEQVIWNLRRNFKDLSYLDLAILHQKPNFSSRINRLLISLMKIISILWNKLK